jgi:hypothetical protein
MKNSKQPLNELDVSTYLYTFAAGSLIAGGVGIAVARKVITYFGSRWDNIGEFFKTLRNPGKLRKAKVTDKEMRELYANNGKALVELGSKFSAETFDQVKAGKITPEQAIKNLDGIIPESAKQDLLKKFKTVAPQGAKVGASTLKVTYTKVAGSALPKDEAFKKAVYKIYGLDGNVDGAYRAYQNAMDSNNLFVLFKNQAVFPNKEQWLAATKYQPKKPNLSWHDKLLKENDAYNWHKLIWTIYR